MREVFIYDATTQAKDKYLTQAAVWMDSIRNGVSLDNGEVLKDSLSDNEKQELTGYIMEVMMPELENEVHFKSRRFGFDYDKTEDFKDILCLKVFEEFYRFNNPRFLKDKTKRYTIVTFIDHKSREAMRDLMVEERGLPINAVRNLRLISDAITEIRYEMDLAEEQITAELVFEKLAGKKISYPMVVTLMDLYRGIPSIDGLEEAENRFADCSGDFVEKLVNEISQDTKAAFDEVFLTFSKLELFIFMKEFGYFGEQVRKMTAKEISYQDHFVDMTRLDQDGEKNIEFGDVRVKRPGRNSGESNEILVESVHYVKEKFYSNKFAKVKRKFATLADKVSIDEIRAELKGYCLDLWKNNFI